MLHSDPHQDGGRGWVLALLAGDPSSGGSQLPPIPVAHLPLGR